MRDGRRRIGMQQREDEACVQGGESPQCRCLVLDSSAAQCVPVQNACRHPRRQCGQIRVRSLCGAGTEHTSLSSHQQVGELSAERHAGIQTGAKGSGISRGTRHPVGESVRSVVEDQRRRRRRRERHGRQLRLTPARAPRSGSTRRAPAPTARPRRRASRWRAP